MPKFIPREKLGKKARRSLDAGKRATWGFSPVTRKVETKKYYDRKKSARVWKDDFGMSAFCLPYVKHNVGIQHDLHTRSKRSFLGSSNVTVSSLAMPARLSGMATRSGEGWVGPALG